MAIYRTRTRLSNFPETIQRAARREDRSVIRGRHVHCISGWEVADITYQSSTLRDFTELRQTLAGETSPNFGIVFPI